MTTYLQIQHNTDALCDYAARHWVKRCREVLSNSAACHIALSGGSTPRQLYQRLASDTYREQIDWKRLHIYFGDERCVPHDHSDSNFRMASEAMLDRVPIPQTQVHAVPYHADAVQAANAYQQILQAQFPLGTGLPRFDLVWLGMGDDGHTASLFPGTPILEEAQRWCAEVYVAKMDSWRVSLTYPVINNAAQVCVLINGSGKAQRLKEVLCETGDNVSPPIRAIRPAGDMFWLVDAEAASLMSDDCKTAMGKIE